MAYIDQLAQQWNTVSSWLYPVLWFSIGIAAMIVYRYRPAGIALFIAATSALLINVLFAPGSFFIDDWATDSPMNVTFEYQPLGFIVANLLPAIENLSLIAAYVLLLRNRG